jgi:hypothetical protein
MAENVIDTLKLDIIVNTKQNGQSVTTLKNSLEKLYKTLDCKRQTGQKRKGGNLGIDV